MKHTILRLLNIKASESKHVFDLLSIQFSIGLANSYINIVAFTFFIHHFAVNSISYAYMVIAGFLLLLNVGYEKLERRLPPLNLFRSIIAISAVILLMFWAGLLNDQQNPVIFALLVWGTLFYMATSYAYWGIASLLFNIRESRRIFAIVGSGDIPAKLIGYVTAPLLIPLIGIDNLLLLSMAALGAGFLLINRMIGKGRWQRVQQKAHAHHEPRRHGGSDHSLITFLVKNKLIFFISLLSLLSYNVFNLIDYTFVTQIKTKISDLSDLATYTALFFAVGRTATLVLKLVFTSRMIERLGIITCLMITPITLFVCSILFVLFDQPHYTLYEFGIMAMLTEVLRSAMQEPVFLILFQPLNEHARLRGHVIAKGYMLAPSLLIVGASLLIAEQLNLTLTIPFIIKVLLLNLIVWALIIHYLKKAYARALHQSIAKGVFNGEDVIINDQDTIRILLGKLDTGTLPEKIYALKLLEGGRYAGVRNLLQQQLFSSDIQLKRYAFDRLEATGGLDTDLLEAVSRSATDPETQELVIAALCSVNPQYLHHYTNRLGSLSPELGKKIMLLLLKQKEFGLLYTGCREINNLLHSDSPEKRELALEIISELDDLSFTEALEGLICDPDAAVKRNALIAACKLKSKALLPLIMERLQSGTDKYLAMQGLFQYGDALFDDLQLVPQHTLKACRAELIKIAGKLKGPRATAYLLQLLREKDTRTERVIHALWGMSFQAETVADIYQFQSLLHAFIQHGVQKTGLHAAVPNCPDRDLLKRSLETELWNDLSSTLKVCAILYSKKEINRVIELAENQDRQRLYNGMEMLELMVPKKTAREINELLDYLLDPQLKKKHARPLDTGGFFREIVLPNGTGFNAWTRAICLYSCWRLRQQSLLAEVKSASENEESPLFCETRSFVLTNLEPRYATH